MPEPEPPAETMPAAPRRILIVKPSSLGDVIHALPVLTAVRRGLPRAHVAWLVARPFAALLEGHPLLDELIVFDRRRFGRMWFDPRALGDFLRFVSDLRRRRFDWVIDLQGLFRSGFLAWASGARRRTGFANARELAPMFYSERMKAAPTLHAVERNLALAEGAGLAARPVEFSLNVSEEERNRARELLRAAAGRDVPGFVALVPGARWESKLWPPERFAEAAERLAERGMAAVLLGAPADAPLAAEIRRVSRTALIDLVGKTTPRELTALVALSSGVISADSGPMHIAAALGVPLVALFGPTDARLTGPYAANARVARTGIECSPCMSRRCPLGHHKCMRELGVGEVLAGLESLGGMTRPSEVVSQVEERA